MDPNHHKWLVNKAETYYAISRDLENEAANLMEKAEFLSKRGDAISEQAMAYFATKAPDPAPPKSEAERE